MSDRRQIRRHMRALRNAIDAPEAELAAARLCNRLARSRYFMTARRIAAYLPNDGEIDVRPLIALAWKRRRAVFLPVLRPGQRLGFAPYTPATILQANRFGIPEPTLAADQWVDPRSLDLVLMPLVAFDRHGNRLGMGGGYYDRSFAFLQKRKQWHRPRLIGVAYDFQCVDDTEAQAWDVPASQIVTDRAIYPQPE